MYFSFFVVLGFFNNGMEFAGHAVLGGGGGAGAGGGGAGGGGGVVIGGGGSPNSKIETPNVKKRHRRAKSGTNKNLDADGKLNLFDAC